MNSFSEIYTNYYKSSFLFVKSFVRDDMISEDIVSNSLIRLWETMKKEPVTYPQALLLKILKHSALNYLKHCSIKEDVSTKIKQTYERDIYYRISTLQACDPNEIYSREISSIVKKTLLTLSPKTRKVFEMSRYRGCSVKEIANEMDLSTKSVEYHMTQALKSLRLALKDYLPLLFFLLN